MLDTVIFSLIKGLPFSIKKKLIEDHKSPKKAIVNLKISLREVNSKTGLKILNQINSNAIVEKAEKIIQECMESKIQIIPYWDNFYPKDLIHCIDAPFLIYSKGEQNPNTQSLISIVGTRNCTDYGLKEIKRDYNSLIKLWNEITSKTIKSNAPCLIHEEDNLIKRCLRDYFDSTYDEILINDKKLNLLKIVRNHSK